MDFNFYIKNYRHWIKRMIRRGAGGNVSVGRHTYGAPKIRWWGEQADLRIGKYCSIAEGVEIYLGGNHRVDWISTYPFSVSRAWPEARDIKGHPQTRGDVVIGHDVWLGAGCVILSGVRIGNGAVIGCRAVVSRDVPDYGVVAGNPGMLVRMRFDPPTVERLLRSAWWNWSDADVRQRLGHLLSSDTDTFLSSVEAHESLGKRRGDDVDRADDA